MPPRIVQSVELLKALALPGGVRAFLQWKPFSITAFTMTHALVRRAPPFRTVIDAGANVGQFSRAAAERYPQAQIVAFEPLPDAADRFRAHLAGEPRVRLLQAALGDEEGTLTFHRHAYTLASSALPLEEHAQAPKRSVTTLEVPVARLDTALADEPLPGPVLLKMDLQGYELEALRGAARTLTHVSHVLIETSFRRTYAGEPHFEDVLDHLRAAGFRLDGPLDVLRDRDGVIYQMDALFVRREDL